MNNYFKIYILLIAFFSFSFNPIEFKTGGVKSSEISLIGETSKLSDDLFSDLNSDTLNDLADYLRSQC